MITEDYVSFETAKLLKEKGFDGKCSRVWLEQANHEPLRFAMSSFVEGEEIANKETVDAAMDYANEYMFKDPCIDAYLCPTIQMALKWLRDIHKFNIATYPTSQTELIVGKGFVRQYSCDIFNDNEFVQSLEIVTGYEKACEAGIKYCLEKLVK